MEQERAWAAGFFDGEGCTSTAAYRTKAGRVFRHLVVSVGQKDRKPLERFHAAVGGGRIYGPDKRGMYRYHAELESALGALGQMWPHLCSAKREQALAIAERITPRHPFRRPPSTGSVVSSKKVA